MRAPLAVDIRPFDWSHVPALTLMWVESWQEAMPEIDFEERRGWFADHLGGLESRGAKIAVAFAPGEAKLGGEGPAGEGASARMAGFATLEAASGHVDQLAVHPDFWGRGVADALLRWAGGHARGPLRLEVNAENTRALRFYEKAGFTVTGHGANPLSGRPTLTMERRGSPAGGRG